MRSGLSEQQAGADPLRLFGAWLEDAVRAGLPLPNAMTLATVSAENASTTRTSAPVSRPIEDLRQTLERTPADVVLVTQI